MITLTQVKKLRLGQTIFHNQWRNADHSPQRWKINGKPKKWKRDPNRIKIPLKNGLIHYSYLTNDLLPFFSLTEEDALN